MRWCITMGVCGVLWAGCTPRETRSLRWPESLRQLDRGAQCAHLRANHFEAAAQQAEAESLHGAQRLFMAMACAERLQEQLLQQALHHLQGEYALPYMPPLPLGSTTRNLHYAHQLTHPYAPTALARVALEGNRYAMRLLIRHAASCNRCRRAVEHYRHGGEHKAPHYGVCPTCGYLTDSHYLDPYCPQCGRSEKQFLGF